MKRLFLFLCISVIVYTVQIPVYAVESKVIKKIEDGTDTFIDISQEGSTLTRTTKDPTTGETTQEPYGKRFDYRGKVGPNALETPDFKKMYEEWLWKASQSLLPQSIQDDSDDPTKYYDQSISGRSYLCVYNPDNSPKDEGPGGGGDRSELRSVTLPWLNFMRRTTRQIRLVLSPPEIGFAENDPRYAQKEQKYNQLSMDLANPPRCTDDDIANLVRSTPTGLLSVGSFSSFWDWLFSLGSSKGEASVKTLIPGRVYMTNFTEIPKSELKGNDTGNASSFGTVEGFLPQAFAAFGPVIPGSTLQKDMEIGNKKLTTEIGYDYSKANEQARKSLLCSLLPDSLQKTVAIEGQCQAMPTRSPEPPDRSRGMEDPEFIPLPGQEELCGGENACDTIGAVTPTNYNCGYTSADVAKIEGPAQLKSDILKASNLSGIPPKILATALTIENRGGVSIYAGDNYIAKTGGEATRCGTVGPMGISYSCQVDASCAHAKDNWQTWCKYKGFAGAARGNAAYDPDPRNVADALAVGAGILRGWEKERAKKGGRSEKGCTGWTVNDAIELEHLYFAGLYMDQPGNQCSGSTTYRDENLYNVLKDSIGSKADNYDRSQAGTLTVCEFVEGYYNNH